MKYYTKKEVDEWEDLEAQIVAVEKATLAAIEKLRSAALDKTRKMRAKQRELGGEYVVERALFMCEDCKRFRLVANGYCTCRYSSDWGPECRNHVYDRSVR